MGNTDAAGGTSAADHRPATKYTAFRQIPRHGIRQPGQQPEPRGRPKTTRRLRGSGCTSSAWATPQGRPTTRRRAASPPPIKAQEIEQIPVRQKLHPSTHTDPKRAGWPLRIWGDHRYLGTRVKKTGGNQARDWRDRIDPRSRGTQRKAAEELKAARSAALNRKIKRICTRTHPKDED